VSDDLRERIRAQYGDGIPERVFRTRGDIARPVELGHFNCAGEYKMPEQAKPAIAWPVTLHLPWSTLVSDNEKFRAMLRGDQAIMVIKRPYREASDRIHQLAMSKAAGAQPAAEPLQLVARVWFPDNNVRDMTNWSKLVFDALKGAVYEDDRWLHDVRWIRMGTDVDAPRAEITITPLLP
jgi:Holliday junction resolvase RusA-like endonuclease